MTEQELKKLSRSDLLQLVLDQDKAMDLLRERIASMERAQREKSYNVKRFGSIAESALQVSGIFEAAQRAADQYLQEAEAAQASALRQKAEAEKLLSDTKELCQRLETQTREKCDEMTTQAEAAAKEYWLTLERDVLHRLETYDTTWKPQEAADPPAVDEETAAAAAAMTDNDLFSYLQDLDIKYGDDEFEDDEDEQDEDEDGLSDEDEEDEAE